MSRTPFFYVERYNSHTERYELQHPIVWNYEHTRREPADLYPYNGDHDLFSIVEHDVGEYEFPNMFGIHGGLPKDVSKDIRNEYDKCCYETSYEDKTYLYTPKAHWFTYADMYIYCIEHPVYKTYDNKKKPTPLKRLKDRVDAFFEVMDGWDWREDYSQIRIVYWIE